jgi:hypothetical protein
VVHFAIEVNGAVRPLCGDWAGDPSWTRIRAAVSCPRCLERLCHERTRRGAVAWVCDP